MSFRRKAQTQVARLSGTRPSRSASTVSILSTGIPSLDDVLGGGVPLGSVLVVLAPDPHTTYAELVQRHFVSQGIASGQSVCILDDSPDEFASSCMWVPSTQTSSGSQEADEAATEPEEGSGVKIAWRYENMKKFQTSVDYTESREDAYCLPLDLTSRIPEQVINAAVTSKCLYCLPVPPPASGNAVETAMAQLKDVLSEQEQTTSTSGAIRLAIPNLGSPQWGNLIPSDILRLLHYLRARLRQDSTQSPRISALITLPSYFSQDDWGGPGWSQKLGWLSDGCVTLRSFSSDPALLSIFPSQHGLVSLQSLPAPHTLIPPSDKFSELRGISTFSSSATGGGENNLAFKCTRKRFIIETLHLDVEGGVSERRTTIPVTPGVPARTGTHTTQGSAEKGGDAIAVQSISRKKPKKSVAFQSDRPDLYDF